jgi:nucleotide-binding universal stress UspA family protein
MIRFQTILCPVDFFPGSLHAFEYALKLARNYEARVIALHVVEPVIPAVYEPAFSVPDLTNELEKESKRQLKNLSAKAAKAGVRLDTEVKVGDISTEIRAAIDKTKADLVVIGTHGSRGFERWLLGSVTERLMRHCSAPLLVIGGHRKAGTPPPEIGSILMTTDFSDGTPDALRYAFTIAQESQAKIDLLHVVDELVLVEAPPDVKESMIDGIRQKLESLVPDAVRPWCEVRTTVTTGSPYQSILKVAKKDKVGLIVMNIHGKGMLDRVLVGSTAERVVRGAECPVLLIPPKATAKAGARPKRERVA